MRGYRFYLQYPNKKEKRKGRAQEGKLGNHSGNVIAAATREEDGYFEYFWGTNRAEIECVSAVFLWADSSVCYCTCSFEYLEEKCKHISEAVARTVHPKLFEYLDEER